MKRIEANQLAQGDVVLNLGDPDYPYAPTDYSALVLEWEDVLLRTLSYLVIAERVLVPSRYLLESGAVRTAIGRLPQLLQEGLVVPQIHANETSFADLAAHRKRGQEAIRAGEWLDLKSAYCQPFDVQPLSVIYRRSMEESVREHGYIWNRLDANSRAGIPGLPAWSWGVQAG